MSTEATIALIGILATAVGALAKMLPKSIDRLTAAVKENTRAITQYRLEQTKAIAESNARLADAADKLEDLERAAASRGCIFLPDDRQDLRAATRKIIASP